MGGSYPSTAVSDQAKRASLARPCMNIHVNTAICNPAFRDITSGTGLAAQLSDLEKGMVLTPCPVHTQA